MSEILDLSSLIIARYLNYTIGLNEVWERSRNVDDLVDRVKDIIIDHNLVDIFPSMIIPTWDNGRTEVGYVAKRLDRFLLHGQLVEQFGMVHYEVMCSHISDHRPISLH